MLNPQENSNRTKRRENRGITFNGGPQLISRPNRRAKVRHYINSSYKRERGVEEYVAIGSTIEKDNKGATRHTLYSSGAVKHW